MGTVRRIAVVGAAILHREQGLCLATRRSGVMSHAGLWEFPGGKVECGESPQEALVREIGEELGICVEIGDFVARGEDFREDLHIVLDIYKARWIGGEIVLSEHDHWGWFDAEGLGALEWPFADRPAVEKIIAFLQT